MNPETMYTFIVNPYSRTGLALRIWKELKETLKDRQIRYRVFFTRRPGDASRIARTVISPDERMTLVVLGGDGTVGEVVNGIRDLSLVTLGYIPIGSGNDFARSMKLSADPGKALFHILNPVRYADINIGLLKYQSAEAPADSCGAITRNTGSQSVKISENPGGSDTGHGGAITRNTESQHDKFSVDPGGVAESRFDMKRRFAVSAGMGFDAEVCRRLDLSKMKNVMNRLGLGRLSYTGIALKSLFLQKPGKMTVILDDERKLSFQKVYFAAFMNQRYEGGGFMFCPAADPGDDVLDLIVVDGIPKLKILFLLPTAFFGKHTRFRGICIYRCKRARILSETALTLHTDGEPHPAKTEISVSLEPEKLRLICY